MCGKQTRLGPLIDRSLGRFMDRRAVRSHSRSHPPQCVPQCVNEQTIMQTTIMAVEFDGGVVLGADSRTSTGAFPSFSFAGMLAC